VATAKEQLRRTLRRVRDSVSADAEAAAVAAEAAAQHLIALAPVAGARTVALYAPVRGELDPGPAARALDARGARLVYPRVLPKEKLLEFHEVLVDAGGPTHLHRGAFGIPEPLPSSPFVPLAEIDLLLVPGLAFDERGSRLGWGRGFYDRTLARAPAAIRVGYCYSCQLVAHVPHEDDDLPMHYLVTDTGVAGGRNA
jgi:5-formyltetrahydrofolate cyclo-ligase